MSASRRLIGHNSVLVVPVDRMTQDEKTEIVGKLNQRGVFAIKGAVSLVAKALNSSEASIYRYLSKVKSSEG